MQKSVTHLFFTIVTALIPPLEHRKCALRCSPCAPPLGRTYASVPAKWNAKGNDSFLMSIEETKQSSFYFNIFVLKIQHTIAAARDNLPIAKTSCADDWLRQAQVYPDGGNIGRHLKQPSSEHTCSPLVRKRGTNWRGLKSKAGQTVRAFGIRPDKPYFRAATTSRSLSALRSQTWRIHPGNG